MITIDFVTTTATTTNNNYYYYFTISCIAEKVLASQKGLYFVELVS